jgi:hypothetical protein
MDAKLAVLVSMPPLLAIMVEMINPVSEEWLKNEAERIVKVENLLNHSPDVIASNARGAIAVASLAPTLLSVVSGSLAVIAELADIGFVFLAIFILVMTFLTLRILRIVSGLSYYQIAITSKPLNKLGKKLREIFGKRPYGPLHTKVISRFIYKINSVLLMNPVRSFKVNIPNNQQKISYLI